MGASFEGIHAGTQGECDGHRSLSHVGEQKPGRRASTFRQLSKSSVADDFLQLTDRRPCH
jgi:hypothetical protein